MFCPESWFDFKDWIFHLFDKVDKVVNTLKKFYRTNSWTYISHRCWMWNFKLLQFHYPSCLQCNVFFFCQQNAKGKGLWWCPWDFSFLSLWRHTVGFVFSYAFPLRKYSWDLQLTHSYSLPLISPLFTSFLSSNLLSSSSPSPLAPAVHPVSLFPLAPFHPTFTPHYPTPSLLPLALSLSHSRRGRLAGEAVGAAGQFSILDVRPQIGTQACG